MKLITPSAGTAISPIDILQGFTSPVTSSIASFKTEFKKFTGKRFCYFVNSGTNAFYITLKAIKNLSARNPERNEVILPAYTAPSLILPIKKASLKPVLCDVSMDTFNMDLDLLSDYITDKTLCVVPVHMFGLATDMNKINKISNQKGAFVIEDAASSLGTKISGAATGSFGDAGFFSLNRGKNLSTMAGGCMVTHREDIAKLIEAELKDIPELNLKSKIKIIGKTIALSIAVRPLFFTLLYNLISKFKYKSLHSDFDSFAYTCFQAGVGISLFKRSRDIFKDRHENGIFLYKTLQGIEHIKLPKILPDSMPVFNQFPLIINEPKKRDLLFEEINKLRIECTVLYPYPIHKAHNLGYDITHDPFPNASYMAERLLLIPTHAFMDRCKLKKIVDVIKLNC